MSNYKRPQLQGITIDGVTLPIPDSSRLHVIGFHFNNGTTVKTLHRQNTNLNYVKPVAGDVFHCLGMKIYTSDAQAGSIIFYKGAVLDTESTTDFTIFYSPSTTVELQIPYEIFFDKEICDDNYYIHATPQVANITTLLVYGYYTVQ